MGKAPDHKAMSVYEVLGAHVTDLVFNGIYASARQSVPSGGSVTEEFTRQVKVFALGIKSDQRCYSDLVRNLHHYYQEATRYTTLTFVDFVDQVVKVCVPPEYYEDLTTGEKDEILSGVLCDLVARLAVEVTRPPMLRRVIDARRDAPGVTARMLQDAAVRALIARREHLANRFLGRAAQASDQIPASAVQDMKRVIRRLVHERNEARADADEAAERADDYKQKSRELRERCAKLERLVGLVRLGRAEGPAAAVAALRIPARDRLAEREPPRGREGVPRRDRLAENRRGRRAGRDKRRRSLSDSSGTEESGTEESGTEESGSEESGTEESGTEESRSESGSSAESARPRRGRGGKGARHSGGRRGRAAHSGRASRSGGAAPGLADFFRPVGEKPPDSRERNAPAEMREPPAPRQALQPGDFERLLSGDWDGEGDE